MDEQRKNEVLRILYAKYCEAKSRDIIWNTSNYEWEMGLQIANLIVRPDNGIFYFAETQTFYGIPVRFNHEDPLKIQLWKKV